MLEKRLNSSSYLKFKEDKKEKGIEGIFLMEKCLKKEQFSKSSKVIVERTVSKLLRLS